MIGKEPIEEKLEELGRSIGADESLAEKVMKRIEAEPDKSEQFRRTKVRRVFLNRLAKLVVAAGVIVAVWFLFTHSRPNRRIESPAISQTVDSPAELMTLASLNIALRDGGIEALDKQLDKAFKKLGPWPVNSKSQTIQDYSICMHIE